MFRGGEHSILSNLFELHKVHIFQPKTPSHFSMFVVRKHRRVVGGRTVPGTVPNCLVRPLCQFQSAQAPRPSNTILVLTVQFPRNARPASLSAASARRDVLYQPLPVAS